MKYKLLIILLLLSSICYADIFKNEFIIMNVEVKGELDIIKTQPYEIDYVNVNLSFFPKITEYQSVLSQEYKGEKIDNAIIFSWEDPKDTEEFLVKSKIKVEQNIGKVRKKINFPIKIKEHLEYTLPTKNIDSDDDEVIDTASRLVKGETDMFSAIFNIGKWIKENIEYSLDTLTAEAVQKPSWVLDNRYGVCDEITSLFVAMVRSIGIPARYVSGLAYTNYNNINDFGSHAWAEVYFPDYGWIPFDVTYGEFGFLDATHITLMQTKDSAETSTRYEWKANNIEIKAKAIDFDVDILETKHKEIPAANIELKLVEKEIKLGSYNLLEITFVNHNDYYMVEDFHISAPKEITIENDFENLIFLKPKQVKTVYALLKLDDNLDKNYIYDFPIAVYTSKNTSISTEFQSSIKYDFFSKEYFNFVQSEEELTISQELGINCISDKKQYYTYETPEITCKIINEGNIALNNLQVSLEDITKEINLGISQSKDVKFKWNIGVKKQNQLFINVKNNEITKKEKIDLEILNTPKIMIQNISVPNSINYGENFELNALLKLELNSAAYKTKVFLNEEEFHIGDIKDSTKLSIANNKLYLDDGSNTIPLIVEFYDLNNKKYTISEDIIISQNKSNILYKFWIRIKNLFNN